MQIKNIDVVIIGAGISGMVAAYTILEKEPTLDIIILEAQDRLGGRTLSVLMKVNGQQTCEFDLGGHWLSSSQPHLINIVKSLNLTLIPQYKIGLAIGKDETSLRYYTDHPILGNFFTRHELKRFFSKLENRSKNFDFKNCKQALPVDFLDSITMENYINTNIYTTLGQNIVRALIRSTCGVEPSQISLLYYLMFCNSTLGFSNQYLCHDGGAREFWIKVKEGAQEICSRLANKIGRDSIEMNRAVLEVCLSPDEHMLVKTLSGHYYKAEYVIFAIPPQEILKIRFSPPLSKLRRHLLQQMQVGHLTKFIITYEQAFWRRKGYSGEILSCDNNAIHICYDATKNNHPALTGYIGLSDTEKQDISNRNKVISYLIECFGDEARNPIDYVEKSWFEESYIGGCPMSCDGIGTIKCHHLLKKNVERMYWAGTETSTEWNGYMNGAVQAGYRAAIEVLYELRPQTLTYKDLGYVETKRSHKVRFNTFEIFNIYTVTIAAASVYIFYRFWKK